MTALAFRNQRHSVGLGPPNRVQPIGDYAFASGVLIQWNSRVFVATAGHFLDRVPASDVHVLFPADKGFKISTDLDEHKERLLINPDSAIPLAKPLGSLSHARSATRTLDLAVLEIERKKVPLWCEVYKLDRVPNTKTRVGTMTMILGMPAAVTAVNRGVRRPIIRRGWGGLAAQVDNAEPTKWEEWDSRFSIQLRLDSKGTEIARKIGLNGFSGSGVWMVESPKPTERTLWSPTPLLLGIQIAHRPESGKLQITSIKGVIQLLASEYGSM